MHVHINDGQGEEQGLSGQIGPFTEQEIPEMANQAVTMTDSQKVVVGPFQAVDKKGKVLPTAPTGLTGTTGDATLLTSTDNGDGTFTFAAQNVTPAGGTVQGVVTDSTGSTMAIDFTIVAGAEAALTAPIGAPVEQ